MSGTALPATFAEPPTLAAWDPLPTLTDPAAIPRLEPGGPGARRNGFAVLRCRCGPQAAAVS